MHGFGVCEEVADGNANGEALDGMIEAENIIHHIAAFTVDDTLLV